MLEHSLFFVLIDYAIVAHIEPCGMEDAAMAEIIWEYDLATALERAGRERRFVLADFSKEH